MTNLPFPSTVPPERQEAAERATAHADRVEPEWRQQAAAAFMRCSSMWATGTFTASEVRCCLVGLPEPPDGRAWGTVIQGLVRGKRIIPTGEFRKDSFGSPKPVYRLP